MFQILAMIIVCFIIGWFAGMLTGLLFCMVSDGIELDFLNTFALICGVSNSIYAIVHTLII